MQQLKGGTCRVDNGFFEDFQRAAIASSFDDASGTMDVIMSAESPVFSWDPLHGYVQRITLSKGLKFRAGKQCPFLDNHNRWSEITQSVLGSARGVTVEDMPDGRQCAKTKVHFDMQSEEGQKAAGKYKGGHLTDVSIGFRYESQKAVLVKVGETKKVKGKTYESQGDYPLLIVEQGEIWELSAVPVGADPDARAQSADLDVQSIQQLEASLRRKEENMAKEVNAPAAEAQQADTVTQAAQAPVAQAAPNPPENVVSIDAVRAQARQAALDDAVKIQALGAKLGVPTEAVQAAIKEGLTPEKASVQFIEQHGGATQAVAQRVNIVTQDADEKSNPRNITAGFLATMGDGYTDFYVQREAQAGKADQDAAEKSVERGRKLFRGIGLQRAFIRALQTDTGREFENVQEAIQAAGAQMLMQRLGLSTQSGMSGAALSYLFDVTTNVMILKGYNAVPSLTGRLVNKVPCRNYLTQERVGVLHTSRLQPREQGAAAKHGTINDRKETYKVTEFAQTLRWDQQAIINDDTNTLMRSGAMLGAAAARIDDDAVLATLMANAAMGDSVALFHATHRNLDSGGGSAMSISAIKAGRAKMAKQYVGSGKDKVNLAPQMKYILTNTANAETAWEALNTQQLAATGSTDALKATRNILNTYGIEVIGVPHLDNGFVNPFTQDAVDANTTVWFGFADPAQWDGLEVGYIDAMGTEPVITPEVMSNGLFGVAYHVQKTIGVGVNDFVPLYKAAGA